MDEIEKELEDMVASRFFMLSQDRQRWVLRYIIRRLLKRSTPEELERWFHNLKL